MKETKVLMGMPVTVEIVDAQADVNDGRGAEDAIRAVFDYFNYIDEKFSTYKDASEIVAINRGELPPEQWSEDMKTVFILAEKTKMLTDGYFDIKMPDGKYDPSGIVKGWAVWNASDIITKAGFKHFYVDAGGDIQTSGMNAEGEKWVVHIKNPWNNDETMKVVCLSGEGIATSGTHIRGDHIYNPRTGAKASEIASLTVIGPNVYEADRFATGAFAMGNNAISYIENLRDMASFPLEGYAIDNKKIVTMTNGFAKYVAEAS